MSYANPRIDQVTNGNEYCANASTGRVYFDPVKVLWVGGMMLATIIGGAMTISSGAIALWIFSTGITLCLGHSLGMHRRFIHRSYECPRAMEYLFVHFGTLVGIAGPFGMLWTHDLRDWAQRQRDCHDYFSHGQPWYRDAVWQLFCSIELENPPEFDIEPQIRDDRVYQLMEKTWMWQQLPWALLFYALGGIAWVVWGICARVTVSIVGHWLIGYFAHNHGHRDWHVNDAAVQGHNVRWCALITMGESWHNNHHAFPGSAKLGLEKGQWDPGWWILFALARAGVVRNIKLPQNLPTRDDLRRIDK